MNASSDQKEPVVEPVRSDEQPNELTARALRHRIRQQELLAELGVLALQRTSFDDMLSHTARITAEGLGAEYCKVMEYIPAENRLLVRAGVGWGEGVVGVASVGADRLPPVTPCAPASRLFRTISKMSSGSGRRNCLSSMGFAVR